MTGTPVLNPKGISCDRAYYNRAITTIWEGLVNGIFIGFLFIFLDFNLNIAQMHLELIPDFVGYIMVANGVEAMAGESPNFGKAKPFAVFMVFCSGIIWLANLFGGLVTGPLSVLLGIVTVIISLYISNKIVCGVKDVEEKSNTLLNGASLHSAWKLLAVFTILSLLLSLIIPILAILCAVVSLIAAICFLFAFNGSKNLYDGLRG